MPRPKRNSPRYGKGPLAPGPHRVPYPKTQALVLLDSSAIRKKAAKACEQARKKYASLATEWERYQIKDTPEFSLALALCAGPLREELRELLPKYEQLATLLDAVIDEVLFSGDDPSVCLARVEARAEEEDHDAEADDRAFDDSATPEDESSEDAADRRDEEDAARDAYDDLLRRLLDQFPNGCQTQKEDANACRMKDLYRTLVRALHPDQGGHMTPGRMSLWHEVQEAYHNGDLARMEFLHTKCGMVTDLASATTPVSRLLSITALFDKSFRDLQRKIHASLVDPAWGFSTLSGNERAKILRKSENILKKDVNRVKQKVTELEAKLEEIRHPSKRPQRKKRGSRRAMADDDAYDLFD